MVESISKKPTGRLNPGCLNAVVVLFLSLFCVIGLAIGTFLSFVPIYRAVQSRSWRPMPCEVLSSRAVRSGNTFSPDIQYRYHIDDRAYIGTRYNFLPGSDNFSDYPSVVGRYPEGRQFECYVNPADPAEAVVDRELSFGYYFGLIFVVCFTIFPAGFMVLWLRVRPQGRQKETLPDLEAAGGTAALDSRLPSMDASGSGPLELTPATSPLGKVIFAVIFAAFWNCIVGLFTYFEITSFMKGDGTSWFLAVFLLLFQIVGLGLIGNVAYQMLALANPRPTITLSRKSVPLGGSLTIEWHLSGAVQRVRSLRLTLEGREEAQYQRGTDTHTDTNVFHRATLIEVGDSMGVAQGTTSLRIPADTMHSFTASYNKVIWTIKMKGQINRWPDVDESFEIVVTPR